MKNKDIKRAINLLEDSVIAELMEAAQFALNDENTINRVASEIGLSMERVEMLAGLAVEIANTNGEKPSISSIQELEAKTLELINLKAEFE